MRYFLLLPLLLTISCMQYDPDILGYTRIIKTAATENSTKTTTISKVRRFGEGAGADAIWGTEDDDIYETVTIVRDLNDGIQYVDGYLDEYYDPTEIDFLGIKFPIFLRHKYFNQAVKLDDRFRINLFSGEYVDILTKDGLEKSFYSDRNNVNFFAILDRSSNILKFYASPGGDEIWDTEDDYLSFTIENFKSYNELFFFNFDNFNYQQPNVRFKLIRASKDNYNFTILNQYAIHPKTGKEYLVEQEIALFDTNIKMKQWQLPVAIARSYKVYDEQTSKLTTYSFQFLSVYMILNNSESQLKLESSRFPFQSYEMDCVLNDVDIPIECILEKYLATTKNSLVYYDTYELNWINNRSFEYNRYGPDSGPFYESWLFIDETQ